jgi:phage-related minor tail protein
MKRTTLRRLMPPLCALLLAGLPAVAADQRTAIGEDTIARARTAIEAQRLVEEKAAAKATAAQRQGVDEETEARAKAVLEARRLAEEKAAVEKKAAAERTRTLAQEKAAAGKRVAEEKAVAKRRAAEEKVRILAEKKAAAEKTAVEKKAQAYVQTRTTPVERPGNAVRSETAGETEIRRLVREFSEAVQDGNIPAAQEALYSVELLLPEKSLTVLRLRAWLALSTGDDQMAGYLYREILERLVDDLDSSINLAIIEARMGRADEARRIILDISRRLPDSERLKAARQAFGLTR